jgi:predicted transcriptional regulator
MDITLSMKETILKAMETLPEENAIDEAMERLLILYKIEKGTQDFHEGKTFTQDEVEEMSKQWLK